MTWKELKQAVETTGIRETDEIILIECEIHNGDKSLHLARTGHFVRLREQPDEKHAEINGCAV